MEHHLHLRAYIALLIVLLLASGFIYEIYSLMSVPQTPAQTSALAPYPADLPPLRPQDAVNRQQPFQYLVSYDASGFHPTTLSAKVGETVRFVDNAADPVTIAAPGNASFSLQHGSYSQWTAKNKGTFTFKAGSSTLRITVQ